MRLNAKVWFDRYLGGALLVVLRPLVFGLGLLLRRDHGLEPRGDIAVIKMLGAGSLVIALPNLLALRRRYPERRLVLVTTQEVAAFRALFDVFDDIVIIDPTGILALARTIFRGWRRLVRIDTVIDLEVYSKITTLLALSFLSRNRLAFYLENFYWKHKIATHLLFFNRFSGVYEFYDQMFGLVGVEPLPRDEVQAAVLGTATFLRPAGLTIGIAHTCSPLNPERRLSPEQWRQLLARRFAPTTAMTVELFGGASDQESAKCLIDVLSRYFTEARFVDSSGAYRIADLPARFAMLHEFWAIDSLLLHIARLTDTPVVSIWGPSDPATRLRWRDGARDTVFYVKIPCSPCVHISDSAPCGGDNICMAALLRETGQGEAQRSRGWVVS
jgi:ADP-heptose:LPS heptosyltransferase